MDLEKLTRQVCALAIETGDFVQSEVTRIKSEDIEVKGLHNFVTYVDKTSETRILEQLKSLIPEAGFIAEESPDLQPGELSWVVDPLDGTTNFIHAVPMFCISIALMEGRNVRLGVVYEINQKECFYTWETASAFLNGKVIRVSETRKIADALFATGFPYYDYGRLDDYLQVFRHLMKHSHGIRRLGSAAADLAYVACGRFDGFYEYGLSPWDVAAGNLLVQNAGGKVSDFSGDKNFIFGKEIIASNTLIYNEFLTLFEQWIKKTDLFQDGK